MSLHFPIIIGFSESNLVLNIIYSFDILTDTHSFFLILHEPSTNNASAALWTSLCLPCGSLTTIGSCCKTWTMAVEWGLVAARVGRETSIWGTEEEQPVSQSQLISLFK